MGAVESEIRNRRVSVSGSGDGVLRDGDFENDHREDFKMNKIIENLIYMAGATSYQWTQDPSIHYRGKLEVEGIKSEEQRNRLSIAIADHIAAPFHCEVVFK